MKGGFKIPTMHKVAATVHAPSAPKIHPAAHTQTRVRLPDANSIGADPSPIVPNAGKI